MIQSPFDADQTDLKPLFRLLEIYRTHDELRFPGVSAETLTQATAGIDEQLEEIERLQQQVADARELLAKKYRAVLDLARQAHAYATVYAQASATAAIPGTAAEPDALQNLRLQLAEIQLDEPVRGERKRRARKMSGSDAPGGAVDLDTVTPPAVAQAESPVRGNPKAAQAAAE